MPKYYLLDENKNLVEGFDKEGFLALLEQAIEQGSLENIDENSAVASKIRSVINGTTHHIEFVTQAQFNQLEATEQLVPNTYYYITDDTYLEDFEEQLQTLSNSVNALQTSVNLLTQGLSDLSSNVTSQGNRITTLENKKTYCHNILIIGERDSEVFAISFSIKTDSTYSTPFANMNDIVSAIFSIYGNSKKIPSSGRWVTKSSSSGNIDYNVITIRSDAGLNGNYPYFRIGYLVTNGSYGDQQIANSNVTSVEDTIEII